MKKYLGYKREIKGFQEVKKTLRVVEKAAASHIHLLKKIVVNLKKYREESLIMLNRLSYFYWDKQHLLLKRVPEGKKGLLVITGDKGIVGSLYHDIIEEVLNNQKNYQTYWTLGAKGRKYLTEEGIIQEKIDFSFESLLEPAKMKQLSEYFFGLFKKGGFSQIDIFYPKFLSLAVQVPGKLEFLPFKIKINDKSKQINPADELELNNKEGFLIFEPDKKEIFDILLSKYIKVFLAEIVMEAKLAGFASRTVTAENAVYKTKEAISKLKLNYFKERCKTITQKQLESYAVHKTL